MNTNCKHEIGTICNQSGPTELATHLSLLVTIHGVEVDFRLVTIVVEGERSTPVLGR